MADISSFVIKDGIVMVLVSYQALHHLHLPMEFLFGLNQSKVYRDIQIIEEFFRNNKIADVENYRNEIGKEIVDSIMNRNYFEKNNHRPNGI